MTGNEEWRTVHPFDCYKVSSLGAVKSLKNGRILRQADTRDGYKSVVLYDGRGKQKRIQVHRLVALGFIPNPDNRSQVNHKDGAKNNNCVWNLEWCTPAENQQHRRNVLKRGLRPVVCIETDMTYESIKKAASENNSYIPNIVRACKCGTTAAGMHWRYAERKK